MASTRDVDTERFPEYVWFARNLLQLRQHLGLSQSEFANLVGLTQPFVSALEGMKTNPSLEVLSAIAKATGVSASSLIGKPRLKLSAS